LQFSRFLQALEVAEFNTLTSKVAEQYNVYEQKRLTREDRKKGIDAIVMKRKLRFGNTIGHLWFRMKSYQVL
jgi:hypothetical protein